LNGVRNKAIIIIIIKLNEIQELRKEKKKNEESKMAENHHRNLFIRVAWHVLTKTMKE
jgi:hypothetical protein